MLSYYQRAWCVLIFIFIHKIVDTSGFLQKKRLLEAKQGEKLFKSQFKSANDINFILTSATVTIHPITPPTTTTKRHE
jgi:hypothetical protein